jgi:hypothetical protein
MKGSGCCIIAAAYADCCSHFAGSYCVGPRMLHSACTLGLGKQTSRRATGRRKGGRDVIATRVCHESPAAWATAGVGRAAASGACSPAMLLDALSNHPSACGHACVCKASPAEADCVLSAPGPEPQSCRADSLWIHRQTPPRTHDAKMPPGARMALSRPPRRWEDCQMARWGRLSQR